MKGFCKPLDTTVIKTSLAEFLTGSLEALGITIVRRLLVGVERLRNSLLHLQASGRAKIIGHGCIREGGRTCKNDDRNFRLKEHFNLLRIFRAGARFFSRRYKTTKRKRHSNHGSVRSDHGSVNRVNFL
jgi:hypothetical protein